MKQYLTNTIVKHKNEYIDKILFIEKGIIIEEKTNKCNLKTHMSDHDIIY